MVSVAIGDETAEYSDIIKAFDETVNHKNVNATFKLLDNVYLPEKNNFPGRIGFRSSGTSTLGLNGYTITHADTGYTGWKTASRSRASLPTAKRNSTVSNMQTKPAPSRSTAAR